MYVQDYDEIFCLGQNANGRWYQLMQPYINNDQILFCPSEPAKNPGYGWNIRGGNSASNTATGLYLNNGMGYTYASGDIDTPTGARLAMSQITHPAETIVIGDLSPVYGNGIGYLVLYSESYIPNLHNEGGNYGFVDGHAKWLAKSSVWGSQVCNVRKP